MPYNATHFNYQGKIYLLMDNISNLSTNLPPTKPINDNTVAEIQRDLTTEFKNAAKSVASLYKLSTQRNTVLRHQGYLDAIHDLINVIQNNGDVENWALSKKFELEGGMSKEEVAASSPPWTTESLTKIPDDYKFTMSLPLQHKFPPTMPILSAQRSKGRSPKKQKQQEQVYTQPHLAEGSSSDEEDMFYREDGTLKRRVEENKAEKRPKV